MISYIISVGYNPNYSKEKVSQTLINLVKKIQNHPYMISDEVLSMERDINPETFKDYADAYIEPIGDLTLKIRESEDGIEIVQSASGAGEGRKYKEAARRAVCRIIIKEMHKLKMEINLNVF